MQSHGIPFPGIARYPGEAKLEGPPHFKRESVFAETGVVDALEIVNETHGLNSSQRRPVIDSTLSRLGSKIKDAAIVIEGLDKLANDDLLENDEKARTASFIGSKLREKLDIGNVSGDQRAEVEIESIVEATINPAKNGDWSYSVLDPSNRMEYSGRDLSRIHKDGFFNKEVGRLLRVGDVNDPDVITTGVKLFQRYDSPENGISDSAQVFVAVAFAIDDKLQDIGMKHKTSVSNHMTAAAGSALVARLPLNRQSGEMIDRFCELVEDDPERNGWMHPKWEVIRRQFTEREEIAGYATRMSKLDGYLDSLVDGSEEVIEQTSQAMRQLYEFRKYGVKSSYFRDGVMHCPADSWIVRDGVEMATNERMAAITSIGLANVTLAHAKKIQDIDGFMQDREFGKTGKLQANVVPYNVHFSMSLLADGELSLLSSAGAMSARREFESKGAGNVYEYLRLSQALRVTDLVVPTILVDDFPKIKPVAGKIRGALNLMKLLNPQRLVVPRTRLILENPELIKDELERELAIAEEYTKKLLRKHEVIGHVRTLPKNYRPSPEARIEAAKLGIVLSDNETWVSKHNRGDESIGEVRSHQAVRSGS